MVVAVSNLELLDRASGSYLSWSLRICAIRRESEEAGEEMGQKQGIQFILSFILLSMFNI